MESPTLRADPIGPTVAKRRSNHARRRSCKASKIAAIKIKYGTSSRNSLSVVLSNNNPPTMPPIAPAGSNNFRRLPCPRMSFSCPNVAPK